MAKPLKIVRTNESSWERHRKKQILKISGFLFVFIIFIGLIIWGISVIINDVSGGEKTDTQKTAIESVYTEKDEIHTNKISIEVSKALLNFFM